MELFKLIAKKLGISSQTTWGVAKEPKPLEMPEIRTPLARPDFEAMYGDLPDGAYMAVAAEMGVDITEPWDPKEQKQNDRKERLKVAVKRIKAAGFTPIVCNEINSHVQIKEFGESWNFWAWTGKMYKKGGPKIQERGVHNFIERLKKESKK